MSNWGAVMALYLGGGFKEETYSVMLSGGSFADVPALESTQ